MLKEFVGFPEYPRLLPKIRLPWKRFINSMCVEWEMTPITVPSGELCRALRMASTNSRTRTSRIRNGGAVGAQIDVFIIVNCYQNGCYIKIKACTK